MRFLREAFAGIAAAFSTSLLVMGAIMLAITEGMVLPAIEPSQEAVPPDPMGTMQFTFTTPTQTTKNMLIAVTTQPVATSCPMPSGWEAYTTLKGDTMKVLADARQTTVEILRKANCLSGTSLFPQMLLFLPLAPTPTQTALIPTATFTPLPTSSTCPSPAGWVRYRVRSGDTLFRIGLTYGVTTDVLQKANCLGSRILIFPGDILYVPNVAPRYTATSVPFYPSPTPVKPSPTRTFTVRPTITFTPTFTALPPTPTFTPTGSGPTSTFTPTFTSPASTSTFTPSPTSSNTPLPSAVTPTPAPTNTFTVSPAGTNTPTNTSIPTASMTPSNTPTGN